MFTKFQSFLEKMVGPLAQKMSENKTIQSLTNGMMAVLPVSLGIAFIAIIGNFPYAPWQSLLQDLGLTQIIQDFINITSGLYAIYIVVTIAYETAKIEEINPITAIILSLAFFLILVPQHQVNFGMEPSTMIKTSSIGSDGIFVGMLVSLLVTKFYGYLMNKNTLVIKLPSSVPPMVADSLSPTFVAMIIFILAFIIKAGFAFTPYHDAMTFVNTLITAPITAVGSSPLSVIIIFTFANLLWFFGIHPAAIINLFYAVTAPIFVYNINAFLAGQTQPYLEFMFMLSIIMVGGTGNTIGLAINMIRAKSEKFKALRKLVLIPSVFNINEPIIFGVPIMLNPIFFIPLVSSVAVSGAVIHLFYSTGFLNYMDPTIELPWVMPPVAQQFIYGGIAFAIVMVVVIVVLTLLYLPFFKIADKKALEEELANAVSENEHETIG
ncbi:PTS sugar transporter subunit IIC [Amedibacillus sp. YH-ame6]